MWKAISSVWAAIESITHLFPKLPKKKRDIKFWDSTKIIPDSNLLQYDRRGFNLIKLSAVLWLASAGKNTFTILEINIKSVSVLISLIDGFTFIIAPTIFLRETSLLFWTGNLKSYTQQFDSRKNFLNENTLHDPCSFDVSGILLWQHY